MSVTSSPCAESCATIRRARCVFSVPGMPESSRLPPSRQCATGSSVLGSVSSRGSRQSPSNRFTSSNRNFGVPSRCRCRVSASTAGRNFLGRFWYTRQSVFSATR